MTVVPCVAVGVTTPVVLTTVATVDVPLLQVPLVEVLVSVIVEPEVHIFELPPIAAGVAFTVAVTLAALPQPVE